MKTWELILQFLPKIASGELTLALALEECAHHNPTSITLTAEHKDDGFILSGAHLHQK